MKLICHPTSGAGPQLAPAPLERDWMDATPGGFAYRCLPLNIANGHGWFVLNDARLSADWNGGPRIEDVVVECEPIPGKSPHALSHFGNGVLTFHVRGLFRTPPGFDLWVGGPANVLKDAIQPLTGVVETDWSPATFTMNWRFTRPHTRVTFEAGEPIAMVFPLQRGLVESVEPEMRSMEADLELRRAYLDWAHGRTKFNQELEIEGSAAQQQKWQKEYFRGHNPSGAPIPDHRTKLKVKPFK